MVYCPECGEEIADGDTSCGECGAEVPDREAASTDESFVERYGANPLPFADGRSELLSLYGNLLGHIPIFGGIMKLFVGLNFWCYSLVLTVLTVITLDADVTKRFTADFKYIKDSFYSGYKGENTPPEPPQ